MISRKDMKLSTRLSFTQYCLVVLAAAFCVAPALARQEPSIRLLELEARILIAASASFLPSVDPGATLAEVVTLLDAGADPNVRNASGQTPLHWAVTGATPAIVAALLGAGADPNARDEDGTTPLGTMAYLTASGERVPAIVAALVSAGADPNPRTEDGRTPLHAAHIGGSAAFVAALIEAGADPNARMQDGRTPLHMAATGVATTIVAALADAGADPNARMEDGWTPLHVAAAFRAPPTIADTPPDVGVDRVEDFAAVLEWGHAMHLARVAEKIPAVVDALLDAGADPNAKAQNGRTPWDVIPDDSPLRGTDAYWRLNDARFR